MAVTVALELTEEERIRLESQAAVEGLSAPQFVERLVKQALRPEDSEDIVEMFRDIWSRVPDNVLAKLPADGAHQHDHYLYGTRKKAD